MELPLWIGDPAWAGMHRTTVSRAVNAGLRFRPVAETLEGAAERLAATAGVDRATLLPLVRASVESWARLGAEQALTGPIARGDRDTVARQRAAVAERTPDALPLFDCLTTATQALAAAP